MNCRCATNFQKRDERAGIDPIYYALYQCTFGPEDHNAGAAPVLPPTATCTGSSSKPSEPKVGGKRGRGRSHKLGCKCRFTVRVAAADPSMAQIMLLTGHFKNPEEMPKDRINCFLHMEDRCSPCSRCRYHFHCMPVKRILHLTVDDNLELLAEGRAMVHINTFSARMPPMPLHGPSPLPLLARPILQTLRSDQHDYGLPCS